jgi:hypothetical protein
MARMICLLACFIMMSGAVSAQAAYTSSVTVPLSVSNRLGDWHGDGVGFGTVTVSKEADGFLHFAVSPNPEFFAQSERLTWDGFFFNVSDKVRIRPMHIVVAEGDGRWRPLKRHTENPIDRFDISLFGYAFGRSPVDVLNFHIAQTGLEIDDVINPSREGWLFAAHLRNLELASGERCNQISSMYLAGNEMTPVPLPAAALLFGSGLAGLGAFRFRRLRFVSVPDEA